MNLKRAFEAADELSVADAAKGDIRQGVQRSQRGGPGSCNSDEGGRPEEIFEAGIQPPRREERREGISSVASAFFASLRFPFITPRI